MSAAVEALAVLRRPSWLAILLFCAKRCGFVATDGSTRNTRVQALTLGVSSEAIRTHHERAALRGALVHPREPRNA